MVNYGYDCVGWSAAAKEELATELANLVRGLKDKNGNGPTIEVDGTYPGVRIRKLTWFSAEEIERITDQADRIASTVRMKYGIAQRD